MAVKITQKRVSARRWSFVAIPAMLLFQNLSCYVEKTGYLRRIHSFKGINATTIRQKTSGKPDQNRTCKIASESYISKVIQTIGFYRVSQKKESWAFRGKSVGL